MKTYTNIFAIKNLSEISASYRIIKIRGLKKDKSFQSNQQYIINRLSRELKHPVTIIDRNNEPKLVIKNDDTIFSKLNNEIDLVRSSVYLDLDSSETMDLDFTNPDENSKNICTRFLQFDLNGQLKKNFNLWQPSTGKPFYLKKHEKENGIAIYKGFNVRVIELSKGGFGIVIDSTKKFSSLNPISTYLSREEFNRKYKRKHVIYKYGRDWYEIQVMERDDLTVSEYKINGKSLIDYIRDNIPKPHNLNLADLPSDASVLIYYQNDSSHRAAPSALCYEIFGTSEPNIEFSKKSILSPYNRIKEIWHYRKNYFNKIKYGNTILQIAERPIEVSSNSFSFPSFELGNKSILSFTDIGNNNPFKLAKERMRRLLVESTGFYSSSPLMNQFIVLPRSIYDSYGELFIENLTKAVNRMYPHHSYKPLQIVYEDKFTNKPDYWTLGRHIIDSITNNYNLSKPAYGIIMIPRIKKKSNTEHDKLGALLISEMNNLKFDCSIIHTDVIKECTELKYSKSGDPIYKIRDKKKGKFNGYLKHVAINKVLLNSNKWPFVLNDPLFADISIGIDVIPKTHTAGFTFIDKYARNINTKLDTTENKEKLSSRQIESIIYSEIKRQSELSDSIKFNNIVFHRDGRLFDEELEGIKSAIDKLKREAIIDRDTSIAILEIQKTSFLSLRFFNYHIDKKTNKKIIENPNNGFYYLLNNDCFICSTGKEFEHSGTTVPLQVKYIYGTIDPLKAYDDLFRLTTLAYTKPDDCSRFPLTLKINDIKLSESASEYDADAYKQIEKLLTKIDNNNYE